MIKVVFFDGDGTLWYPSRTKRTQKPHWVYTDASIKDPIQEFEVTPGTIETLEELGRRGIKRVLLSTSPLVVDEAILHRIAVLKHVNIHHLLDDIQVAPNDVAGKGDRIVDLLAIYGIHKSDALMVGDTYLWDYQAAEQVGVRALLIRTDYQAEAIAKLDPGNVINDLSGISPILE